MTDVGKKRVREESPEHDDVLDLLNRQAKTVFLSVEPPSCKNLLDINDRGEELFLPFVFFFSPLLSFSFPDVLGSKQKADAL